MRVPVPLRDVADVALLQRLGPVTAVRAEQRRADLPLEDVLPLVGVRVPVQFAQCPRLEFEDGTRYGLGDRKLAGIDQPQPASLVVDERIIGEESILVRQRRPLAPAERGGRLLGRQYPVGEVHLLLREAVEGRFGHAEVLGQQRLRSVADPVADTERAELREVAVVEDQHEVTRLVAQAFEHVAVAAREIPHVSRLEVVRLRHTPPGR